MSPAFRMSSAVSSRAFASGLTFFFLTIVDPENAPALRDV
jgi:hypothetical protein